MPTTRRTLLGAAGGAATACAAPGRPAKAPGPSQRKLNVAALTPCDWSLKCRGFRTSTMKYVLSLNMGTRESYPRAPRLNATGEHKAQIEIKLKELGPIA